MIPLRDSTRSRTFPVVTVTLIVLNVLIFFRQTTLGQSGLGMFISQYALIPARFTEGFQLLSLAGLFHPQLVTSTFLHGSWVHLISNMLYLWIFGDNIEDRLGRWRYLLLYLLTGVIGNLAHIMTDPQSPIPLIGASGAVAGILGAYILAFPRARITSVIFVLFFFTIREIPAFYFLLFWFLLQILNGITSLGIMGTTVAWWAHIGGFLSGMLLLFLFKKRADFNPAA